MMFYSNVVFYSNDVIHWNTQAPRTYTTGHKHGRVPANEQPEHADNTNSSCMCQKHTSIQVSFINMCQNNADNAQGHSA